MSRNARSYYGYVGLDHNFRPDLTGSFRVGGRYTRLLQRPGQSEPSQPLCDDQPQVHLSAGKLLAVGVSYDYSPSSLSTRRESVPVRSTLSAQSGTVFAAVNHRIMPKLYGSIQAQYQNTTYYGGRVR